MQIVILAAGRGIRMGKLTDNIPKPMLKIKGKSILAHKIEALPKEIDEVIIVTGYLGGKIKEFFGDEYFGKKIFYVEQKTLNGSGGALYCAKDILKNDFLVMMGDDLYCCEDVLKIMQHDFAIIGYGVENPKQFGVIFSDENGNLKEIIEKPDIKGPAFANIGLYKLNRKFFNHELVDIGNGEYGLPQTLVKVSRDHFVKIEKAKDWFPIGNPENLAMAQNLIEKFK